MAAPIPKFEIPRLKELYSLEILDSGKEERFDRYIRLICDIFNVPIALISLVDANREWFKSCIGLTLNECPREIAFCAHALFEQDILVIPNAHLDPRFSKSPVVIGEPHVCFYAGALLRGPTKQPLGTVCVIDHNPRDITEKEQQWLIQFARLVEHEIHYNYFFKKMRKEVEHSLYYDKLTGLASRRLFETKLHQAIKERREAQEVAIFSLKIIKFNSLKSAFGLSAAEEIIKESGRRLSRVFEELDTVSTLEDGAFLVLIPCHNVSKINHYLKKIKEVFETPFSFNNNSRVLSCHIGISICPHDGVNPIELIEKGEKALYYQNTNLEFQFQFYTKKLTEQIGLQIELENLLGKAILEDRLQVYYQPKIDTKTGYIYSAEALCRWKDPKHGNISPQQFVPIAEQSDLIIKLGEWILKKVCMQNYQWQLAGLPKLPISVNIGSKHLFQKDFVQNIEKILTETKLQPQYLDLEITETSLINDLDMALKKLQAITKMGITISLDDFGTGYASLAYLHRIHPHTLKIDKSFIDNINTNARDAFLVHAIISASKNLGYTTVAEGVENFEQFSLLREYQCDYIQGYFFSPPVSTQDFEKMILEGKRLIP